MATETGAVSGTAALEPAETADRPDRAAGPVRAGHLPDHPGRDLHQPGAGLRQRAQLLVPPPPELRLRHPGRRHDLRHPDRRHRPLGRLGGRLRRAGRGGGRQREQLARRRQPGRRRHRRPLGGAGGDRRRRRRRVDPRLRHRQAEGAGLRRHPRRSGRLARRGAGPVPGPADQPVLGRLSLLGLRVRRTGAGAGGHLRRVRRRRLSRPALHDLWPLDLRRRRQPGGRPPLRPQHDRPDHERLRHQRFLRRACADSC